MKFLRFGIVAVFLPLLGSEVSAQSRIDFDQLPMSRFVAVGDYVNVSGVLRYGNGTPVAGYRLYVDDGLRQFCGLAAVTSTNGRFSYTARAGRAGVTEVAFYLPEGKRQAIYVNVSETSSSYRNRVSAFRSLSFQNVDSRDIGLTIQVGDLERSAVIKSGQVILGIVTDYARDHFPLRPSGYQGVVFGVGLGADAIASYTWNTDGVQKLSLTGGAGPYRGKVYVTNASDYGLCWAPGGSLTLGPIHVGGEAALCLGTDGISVGAGVGFLAAAGITIKVWDPKPKPTISDLRINNGASSTTSRTVTLNSACTGTPTHYMASQSSNFSGASWASYSSAPSFTLTTGAGTKTVYFKVKNANGESSVVSDTITLK